MMSLIIGFLLTAAVTGRIPETLDPSCASASQVKAVTKLGYYNLTFTWEIEHFQLFNFGQRFEIKPLRSPVLEGFGPSTVEEGPKLPYSTRIVLQPKFYFTNEILFYTIKAEFNINPRKTSFQYKINGNKSYTGTKIDRLQLHDILDTIEITVNAIFSSHKISTFPRPSVMEPTLEPYPSIAEDLLRLYENDTNYQLAFISENETIMAYKAVMQARSRLFNEMIANGTNVIPIEGVLSRVIQKMVTFCNTDRIENLEDDEYDLFVLAQTYDIPSLLVYISNQLITTMNIDNAIERYQFAVKHNSNFLKQRFFEFIVRNVVEISRTEAFRNLDSDFHRTVLETLLESNRVTF